jgi:hypothetical protein
MSVTDYEIVQAMERFGGHFVKALAVCCHRADADNFNRIRAAFPELWAEYAEHVRMQRDRAAKG